MDDKTAKRLRKRALIKAMQKKKYQDAEDLAQAVLTRFIAKGRGQTIDQALTDSMRALYGDLRNKGPQPKSILYDKDFEASRVTTLRSQNGDQFHYLISHLTGNERAVMVLLFFWELTPPEIAYVFGITDDGVFYRRAQAMKKLRRIRPLK